MPTRLTVMPGYVVKAADQLLYMYWRIPIGEPLRFVRFATTPNTGLVICDIGIGGVDGVDFLVHGVCMMDIERRCAGAPVLQPGDALTLQTHGHPCEFMITPIFSRTSHLC